LIGGLGGGALPLGNIARALGCFLGRGDGLLAALQFVDQARGLYRKHRLIREGCHQLDLPRGEGARHRSGQRDHADRGSGA